MESSSEEMQRYIRNFIISKFKTVEECKTIINLSSFDNLEEEQLMRVFKFFDMYEITDSNLEQYIELSWNQVNNIENNKEKARITQAVLQTFLMELDIKPDYVFYIKLISFLVLENIKGGN